MGHVVVSVLYVVTPLHQYYSYSTTAIENIPHYTIFLRRRLITTPTTLTTLIPQPAPPYNRVRESSSYRRCNRRSKYVSLLSFFYHRTSFVNVSLTSYIYTYPRTIESRKMASGTLYTYLNNFRAYKALIAAQYSGTDVKVDPAFEFGVTNKQEEFLKKFPQGKVPAFESNKKEYLTESNAIAYFVSSEQLKGSTPYEKALVQQFTSYADNEILPASYAWVYPSLSIAQFNKSSVDKAIEDVKGILEYLNNYLLTKTYLVGERITLADITVACSLLQLYQHVINPVFMEPFTNVNRWFDTIVNQPKVVKVIGKFEYCQKTPEFNQKTYSELHGGSAEKKPQAKKEKAPKKAAAPKEVVQEEEPDAADLILAAEPKSSNPFDALPKGTFNMDEFKRVYSNEEESKSIAYFWDHFDKENYSIWFGEYKYNNELQKVFMSCNLISGMYQRLDKMRKQAFASVCLFGSEGDSTISGVWVWRGHDLAFEMSNDWKVDYDVYTWKKLDASSEETKKLVNEYFAWTAKDKDGRPFNQGKIFK